MIGFTARAYATLWIISLRDTPRPSPRLMISRRHRGVPRHNPGRHDTVHDVVHVGAIPLRRAVPEPGNRLSGGHEAGDFVDRQIRALSGPVDREEAKAHRTYAVEMMIRMAQELARLLRGGVR